MYEQDDLDFIDILYQQWSATTGVKDNQYWMPEEDDCSPHFYPYWYRVFATQGGEDKVLIAERLSEADADFITGLHGAIPDLVRRIHELIDENERLDRARDDAEVALAEAYEDIERLSGD